jgi:hypothetical protein
MEKKDVIKRKLHFVFYEPYMNSYTPYTHRVINCLTSMFTKFTHVEIIDEENNKYSSARPVGFYKIQNSGTNISTNASILVLEVNDNKYLSVLSELNKKNKVKYNYIGFWINFIPIISQFITYADDTHMYYFCSEMLSEILISAKILDKDDCIPAKTTPSGLYDILYYTLNARIVGKIYK